MAVYRLAGAGSSGAREAPDLQARVLQPLPAT